MFGVPRGSIFGSPLFNIFLYKLLFIINDSDFTTYADHNTTFFVSVNLSDVILKWKNKTRVTSCEL